MITVTIYLILELQWTETVTTLMLLEVSLSSRKNCEVVNMINIFLKVERSCQIWLCCLHHCMECIFKKQVPVLVRLQFYYIKTGKVLHVFKGGQREGDRDLVPKYLRFLLRVGMSAHLTRLFCSERLLAHSSKRKYRDQAFANARRAIWNKLSISNIKAADFVTYSWLSGSPLAPL